MYKYQEKFVENQKMIFTCFWQVSDSIWLDEFKAGTSKIYLVFNRVNGTYFNTWNTHPIDAKYYQYEIIKLNILPLYPSGPKFSTEVVFRLQISQRLKISIELSGRKNQESDVKTAW